MNNGKKRNITLFDKNMISYLDDLKTGNDLTWDQTIQWLISENRKDRLGMLDLKFKELQDWVSLTFPDRPDMAIAVERSRLLIGNRFLNADPNRMGEVSHSLLELQKELVVKHRKGGN